MEPIVIIVLLFGAFVMGAESADTQQVKTPEPINEQQPKELAGRAVQLIVQTCLSGQQSVIYRDLTIPITPTQIPTLSEQTEPGCPDE